MNQPPATHQQARTTPAVLRAEGCEVIDADWGRLTWYASGKLGNSDAMTVGCCVLKPGRSNPLHRHPNCSEVLVVVEGTILHTVADGREERLGPGDTITIPAGFPHQARNVGDTDAVMQIAFSSADRQFEVL